jgi:hypothetical protein
MERNRHILVDTMGLILAVVVPWAGIQDRDGAKEVFEKIRCDLTVTPLDGSPDSLLIARVGSHDLHDLATGFSGQSIPQ